MLCRIVKRFFSDGFLVFRHVGEFFVSVDFSGEELSCTSFFPQVKSSVNPLVRYNEENAGKIGYPWKADNPVFLRGRQKWQANGT